MSSLKEALSEAMKENGDWMNRMKQDYEIQLRTQRDIVTMYRKQNKKLEEENEKLRQEVVNIVKIKNKQIEKEKVKYESMCSEQAESDCAKYIQELQEENKKLKKQKKNFVDMGRKYREEVLISR